MLDVFIVVVSILLGLVIGYSVGKIPGGKFDGTFVINTTSVKDEILQLHLTTDPDELKTRGEMRIKVEVK